MFRVEMVIAVHKRVIPEPRFCHLQDGNNVSPRSLLTGTPAGRGAPGGAATQLALPADGGGGEVAGRCLQALQGPVLAGSDPPRRPLVPSGRMVRAGPGGLRRSRLSLHVLILPQRKHHREYPRTVRARKTNPGNPDKQCAKADFHVTSRNHMFAKPPAGS
ncbi:hypothetical protein PAL_GLEAN10020884 [Pteropus alecto]|uniref:Uncharacterized protein n=1 Tax=Pteropus alecto TaxID=9402 RepID=L5JR18_PTEAL|nr:hypothetical protein PAL_GLEAN10020884 [Pteropus alecto]